MLTTFRSRFRLPGLRTARRQRQRLSAKALWVCGAALAVWRMAELAQGPQPSSARVWATLGLTLASCFWPLPCFHGAVRKARSVNGCRWTSASTFRRSQTSPSAWLGMLGRWAHAGS